MADGFDDFCKGILNRPTWPGALAPAALAEEFVRHFGLGGFPRFQHLEKVLHGNGVGEIVAARLPDGLRGVHGGLRDGSYIINYLKDDWDGGREHTVLHETYEILQEKFRELCPAYLPPGKPILCRRADRFAAAVLMQPEMFALCAETTGMDVVALQRFYRRSYASVALRLVEVMHPQALLVAIYERQEDGDPVDWQEPVRPESFSVSLSTRTPPFRVSRRGFPLRSFHYPGHLVPRRKDRPVPGSAAFRVIEEGLAVHVERVFGYDLWGVTDLSVTAQPVRWHGHLAKVVLTAVPWRDRRLLEPQFGQGPLQRVPMAFQVL